MRGLAVAQGAGPAEQIYRDREALAALVRDARRGTLEVLPRKEDTRPEFETTDFLDNGGAERQMALTVANLPERWGDRHVQRSSLFVPAGHSMLGVHRAEALWMACRSTPRVRKRPIWLLRTCPLPIRRCGVRRQQA